MSRVLVVGLGYVGLPLAVRAAQVGHVVTGVDLDQAKIELLRAGRTYVEDVSDEQVAAVRSSGNLAVRTGWDTARCDDVFLDFDIAIIAVPTPLRRGRPDLSFIESAGRMIGQLLRPGCTVVLESTTYPGTTEGLLADVLTGASGLQAGRDFHLGFSPERIDPGGSAHTLENTPKLVSATTAEGLRVIDAFYATVVDRTVIVSTPRVAEMAKVFENTQAYVNIALVNELAALCHDLEIDVHEMIDAAMTKGHSVSRWTPGPGVGGHCLPIDPMYLAWQARSILGRPFRLAELADDINQGRPSYVARRAVGLLAAAGRDIAGADVLVLGVSYKPGVGDLRESPAVEVVSTLVGRGARVTIADPHVPTWTLTPSIELEDLPGSVGHFDLVVVTTDHAEFDLQKIAGEAKLVLDCRNAVLPARNVVAL